MKSHRLLEEAEEARRLEVSKNSTALKKWKESSLKHGIWGRVGCMVNLFVNFPARIYLFLLKQWEFISGVLCVA